MLEQNQPAPEFTALNQDGENISLAQYRGNKNVVLYFYPKDDTPGCTIEANEFSALIDKFAAADTDGTLCELYGTWGERQFMGRKYMGIGRSTFVIDRQGNLVEVNYKVKAKGHAAAILELVQGLT